MQKEKLKQDSEYREILKKYYTENHAFIEKAIFTVTASAITFLLGFFQNINKAMFFPYSVCIALFVITLILQLISAVLSREGCDAGLDSNQYELATVYFNYSRFLNNTFLITFCLAILCVSIVIPINFCMADKQMQNYLYEQSISTPVYKYKERKEYMTKKTNVNNGLNPPKAINVFAQDGYNPPKSILNEGFNPPKTTTPKPVVKPKTTK